MSVDSGLTTLSEGARETGQASPGNQAEAVAKLLAGEQDPSADALETGPSPAPEPETVPETLDIKTVAERLGVEPAELYEKLTFTAEDGEVIPLGSVKDRLKASKDLDGVRSELTRTRAEIEADRIRNERELSEILQAIPQDKVSPELTGVLKKQAEERMSREREALLRQVPEWVDAEARNRDRDAILDLLGQYRFTAADLEGVVDHRLLWLLRDYAKLKGAAKAPPPAPKVAVKPQAAKPRTDAQKLGDLKGRVSRRQMSKAEAVDRILSGKV